MEIAVVGFPHSPSDSSLLVFPICTILKERMNSIPTLRSLLNNKSVGIMVVDSAVMATLPDRLRDQLSASVSPTVLGIGTEEHLADTIRSMDLLEVKFQPKTGGRKYEQ